MEKSLSEKAARINVNAIGWFYILSGIWEFLVGLTQAEGFSSERYFLLGVYREYAVYLGLITILVGIILLFKINFARLLALCLAWWNLFTAPLLDIWWNIYAISIKKFLVTDSWSELWIEAGIIILIVTFIRLYIIYMLRLPKAGWIFLKEKSL